MVSSKIANLWIIYAHGQAEKWQIMTLTKLMLDLTHNLKGIFLSFQKIIMILTLDKRTKAMAVERSLTKPPPLV